MRRCDCRRCRDRDRATLAARFAAIVREGFTDAERAHYAAVIAADCTAIGALLERVEWTGEDGA